MKKLLLTTTVLTAFAVTPAFAEESNWISDLGKIFSGEDAITQGEIDEMNAEAAEMAGENELTAEDWEDDEPVIVKREPRYLDNGLENPFAGIEWSEEDLAKFREEFESDVHDESEWHLGVGGYYQAYVGFTDQDATGVDNFGFKRDGEIHFKGETTLDNGLTFGIKVELELEGDEAAAEDDIDEAYAYMSGKWGRVNLGAEDGAAYLLHVTVPSADSNVDGISPKINFVNVAGTFDAPWGYGVRPTSNADKITYFTPRLIGFGGIQLGGSWAPDSLQDDLGSGLDGQSADASTSAAGTLHDVIEGSIRYDYTFDSFGTVSASGAYASGEQSDASADSGTYDGWDVALRYAGEFGAIRVAAGVSVGEEENRTGFGESSDIRTAGVSATKGSWKVGISHFNSSADVGATTDEVDRFSIGAGYTFGPGMNFRGSVHNYDINDNIAAGDNDATAFILGTDIRF